MDAKRYKVIIVGGGPAGSMTALSLVHLRPELAGDILLLESKEFPREKICGGGVSGRVTDFLASMDISVEGIPMVPVSGFTVCYQREMHSPGFGNDKCFVIRRSAFDNLLLEKAMERGVEVRTSTPVVGAYRERHGIVVLVKDGKTYHAKTFVGADGPNGRSRMWFGLPHKGHKTLLLQTDFPRDPDFEPLQNRLWMDYSSAQYGMPSYVWFFPSVGEDGEPVLNTGITGGEFSTGSYAKLREAFLATLEHHPEIRSWAPVDIHFKPYPEREYSPLQVKARDRVIFVGEQLGVDPFTGEGLSICADSAAAAAQEIVEALDNGDFSFSGYGRRLLTAKFFPIYVIGKTYTLQNNGYQPNFFLTMSTRLKPPGKRNVVDYYATTWSGAEESTVLYGATFWKMALTDIAVVFPGWIREISGTSSSRR